MALEEYVKTQPLGQASTTQAPGETFDPWRAAAAAWAGTTAAEANANTAQQSPGQGGRVGRAATDVRREHPVGAITRTGALQL